MNAGSKAAAGGPRDPDERRPPVSRLLAGYLLISALALLGSQRPGAWPLLAFAHVAGAVLLLRWKPWSAGVGGRTGWLLDWLPLLLVPALYAELVVLNGALWHGRFFDPLVIEWERALFGGMPSRSLAEAMPSPWISEPLHAAYLSYYVLIYGPPLLLTLRGAREAFRETVFALMLTFLVHYIFFIYFPVQGPRYLFDAPAAAQLGGYPMNRLAHAILEAGSSQGAAFPSSHVGVAVTSAIMSRRHLGGLAGAIVGGLALLLALGAVYGGFHYAVDALVGALLGGALAWSAPAVRRRIGARAVSGQAESA